MLSALTPFLSPSEKHSRMDTRRGLPAASHGVGETREGILRVAICIRSATNGMNGSEIKSSWIISDKRRR